MCSYPHTLKEQAAFLGEIFKHLLWFKVFILLLKERKRQNKGGQNGWDITRKKGALFFLVT
jgi:hypothetical protein